MTLDANRRALLPSSALPFAYFAFAHAGLATACLLLVFNPGLPGAFFYHPKMIALVHLVTLAWISGSIVGAFYIVAPLALRLPMPVGRADWMAFGAFVLGTMGIVSHFWIGTYDGMAWAALLVIVAIGWVASRALLGLPRAAVPWPVTLHVGFAFGNILFAAVGGVLIGLDRSRGFLGISPLGATYAHAHLAAIGWAAMMVVGLAYRLLPMMLPAAMPTGWELAISAVLIEGGLATLVVALIRDAAWLPIGVIVIAAGLASFARLMRRTLAHRLPRPPALPRRDWSTWQAHGALMWLVVATGLGFAATVIPAGRSSITLRWVYGVGGLVGFLAQIIVGMQGRLVPLYAWYRVMAELDGQPPARAANDLPSARFARILFLTWTLGVPLLAWGLAMGHRAAIAAAAALLFSGVVVGAAYLGYLIRAARGASLVPGAPGPPGR